MIDDDYIENVESENAYKYRPLRYKDSGVVIEIMGNEVELRLQLSRDDFGDNASGDYCINMSLDELEELSKYLSSICGALKPKNNSEKNTN